MGKHDQEQDLETNKDLEDEQSNREREVRFGSPWRGKDF